MNPDEDVWAKYMAATLAGCGGRLSPENCALAADQALHQHRKRYPKQQGRDERIEALERRLAALEGDAK